MPITAQNIDPIHEAELLAEAVQESDDGDLAETLERLADYHGIIPEVRAAAAALLELCPLHECDPEVCECGELV